MNINIYDSILIIFIIVVAIIIIIIIIIIFIIIFIIFIIIITIGVYNGPLDVLQKIIKNEGGPMGLYKGLGANLGGVAPEKAIKLVHFRFFVIYF